MGAQFLLAVCISPIISYSSELRGVFAIDSIENGHTLAIKKFLDVSSHCYSSRQKKFFVEWVTAQKKVWLIGRILF